MNRFREKFKNIEFGPNNALVTPFWTYKIFFSIKDSFTSNQRPISE